MRTWRGTDQSAPEKVRQRGGTFGVDAIFFNICRARDGESVVDGRFGDLFGVGHGGGEVRVRCGEGGNGGDFKGGEAVGR
jgi:hypothetical protein